MAVDLISENETLRFEVAGKMAKVIIELRIRKGGCMPQDLNELGFTPDEVAGNWNAAHFLIDINELTTWGKDDG